MRRLRDHRLPLTLVILAAYTIGSLILSLHFLGEDHSVCVEHQTVHHVEEGEALEAHVPLTPHESVGAIALSEDEHCELLQLVRPFQLLTVRTTILPRHRRALVVWQQPEPVLTDVPHPPRWRTAPKQSPPVSV